MASTSTSQNQSPPLDDSDDHEEEFEHFDDFTLASSWERFISEIEAVCRQWLANGPKNLLEKGAVSLDFKKNLYKVRSELKYAMKNYFLEFFFETESDEQVADWSYRLHDLQLSFGVKDFLVIAPQSASGVVLDAPEASKLLSAVAIASSNCSSLWPAFVPVHDPSRNAYIGIQNMGTVFTRRFESDRIGSQVPIKLMHLEGLYELFVSKFVFSTVDLSMHLFDVHLKMKLTYRTLPYDYADEDERVTDADIMESGEILETDTRNKMQWDDDCPWSEWYLAEDPVKGLELIALWSEKLVESSLDMAELENASPLEADKWFIYPNLSPNLGGSSDDNIIGFASQLHLLVDALDSSLEAKFMEDFISAENAGSDQLRSSAVIPPPTVLDRVLKDLFREGEQIKRRESERRSSKAIKGAPLSSLFAQFCLHALWFGHCNIRAIAVLWIEFVREIRWCWEESQPLPRTATSGSIDLSTCLINQKLHMLAICIEKNRQQDLKNLDVVEKSDNKRHNEELDSSLLDEVNEDTIKTHGSKPSADGLHDKEKITLNLNPKPSEVNPENFSRRGSAGVVESMMLLNSNQHMHAPYTQDPPLMTEDMHEERLQAVQAFSNTFSFSAQLEKEALSSDMSAFKAANPEAVFEDFIRWHSPRDWESDDDMETGWHSPGDWESDDSMETGSSAIKSTEDLKVEWPPSGRLSERMSDKGNSWRHLWNEAVSLPASEQKPLLDSKREGEKILHYLETLKPHQLLEQMVTTAFRAAADTLSQTSFGNSRQMVTKIEQLYPTMASSLKYLQGNNPPDTEVIEDLRRLCVIFGHIERLLTLAASLYRKFLQAPRLFEAIFSDYFNFYLPKMGSGSTRSENKKEFEGKQPVNAREREVVANMFTPPTANQSWRKVLSMGNLLNGHEPIVREIIFSKRDRVSGSYYASRSQKEDLQEIETYRMYISGTSNDLSVALAIASCD